MKLFDIIPIIRSDDIVLQQVSLQDHEALKKMMDNARVYEYLPTFLLEKQYEDPKAVIKYMYNEAYRLRDSLFLGIYIDGGHTFVGLAELYGYDEKLHIVHLGYRLLEEFWGRGLASKTVKLLVDYLYQNTDIEIVSASTLPGNKGSEKVLTRNGFSLVVENSDEDWGFGGMTPTDKWII